MTNRLFKSILGAAGGLLGGGIGAAGAYATGSILNWIGNQFKTPHKMINFNSPEYARLQQMNVNNALAAQNSDNPFVYSPAGYSRIASDTTASMYMKGQELNAAYDPQLQNTANMNKILGINNLNMYSNTQTNLTNIGQALSKQISDTLFSKNNPTSTYSQRMRRYYASSPYDLSEGLTAPMIVTPAYNNNKRGR